MKNILKNEKALLFVGGLLTGTLGVKALKSKTAKKLCVNTLANGMKLQQDAQTLFQSMKEDAEDVCYEASEAAKNKAE
ncbi:DUF6110 family protein [uncultured Clostridium sp.]|uniref:DUF6110 family protein n=1 Tax=uncultured Clostridium sp. TaxID=59620 RepID=UPI0025DBB699|nr:DUF6110 family protein [uncultured Clostridium sp.]